MHRLTVWLVAKYCALLWPFNQYLKIIVGVSSLSLILKCLRKLADGISEKLLQSWYRRFCSQDSEPTKNYPRHLGSDNCLAFVKTLCKLRPVFCSGWHLDLSAACNTSVGVYMYQGGEKVLHGSYRL